MSIKIKSSEQAEIICRVSAARPFPVTYWDVYDFSSTFDAAIWHAWSDKRGGENRKKLFDVTSPSVRNDGRWFLRGSSILRLVATRITSLPYKSLARSAHVHGLI